ncbi:MAG: YgjV family protein [Oscillospiraceae bacterium]|nr:YgjV family protein [Oscillospiraceae bacterium]
MLNLIIGNVCSLLAMITDSLSSTRKNTKEVLLLQSIGQVIYGVGTAILGGYSGAVQNFVSLLRNIFAISGKKSKVLEWTFVALGVVLGLAFNNLGFMGLLPVIANFQYTIAIFRFKDNERALKISFMFCVAMFCCFNFAIYNVVGVVSNLIIFITTAIAVFRKKK